MGDNANDSSELVRSSSTQLAQSAGSALAKRGHAELAKQDAYDYWLNRGIVFAQRNEFAAAIACFLRGIEVDPRDAVVMYHLAEAYRCGFQDYKQALHWHLKAAGLGFPDSYLSLALLYENADVCRDSAEALRWFQKAAKHGHHAALAKVSDEIAPIMEKLHTA